MAPNIPTPLDSDYLTPFERMRSAVQGTLHRALPDLDDQSIWALTLKVTEPVAHFVPPAAVSLTYAWSDGATFTTVDQGIPDNARERAIARALLVHALTLIDERDNPMRTINGQLLAMPCAETNHG
jgi:hypothetical protein